MVRRRRPRPLLAASLWTARALLGVLPVVGVGIWLATAPVFGLEVEIQVASDARVSERWVRDRLAPLQGSNLPTLSLHRAARRLDHDWVREARLVKRLPNVLSVEVVEHQPAAVFASGDRSWVIDRDGRAIVECARVTGLCKGGLVRVSIEPAMRPERLGQAPARNAGVAAAESRDVSGEVLARALKRTVEVALQVRSFEWGRGVLGVQVISDDDYILTFGNRPTMVLVRGSDLAAKASVFELLSNAIREHHDPEVVDLRFRDRIVLSAEAPGVAGLPETDNSDGQAAS